MFSKTYTKYIQSLQHKKARDEDGAFIAEGPKLVPELLAGNHFNCRTIIAVQKWIEDNETLLRKSGAEIMTVQDFELDKISSLSTANQVLAVFEKRAAIEGFEPKGQITLLLDGIQDPGNLGTIIRIADWFAVKNIVCSLNCADIYNSKVIQSTMGSIGRVNIVYTDTIRWLQENNKIAVYGAALAGKNLYEYKNIEEAVIIIGNESKGISDILLSMVSERITIPRRGEAESLNAAVATGIILSQILAS